jgi:peptide-methionine (S)-S-oxide reductase
VSGYAGGTVENPTYGEVCSGTTGHAEVVQITFDPQQISFADLLHVFFQTHDPTTLNRQGADIGSQYRSIVLYHDEDQKRTAEEAIAKLGAEGLKDPIVTEISPLTSFFPAEEYHQEYYARNGNQPYCVFTIDPKVKKLENQMKHLLKS